ncbi:MAG: hypothetical protein KKF44_01735 [Nanoarchaeota archaeon]|nr:hypothetical protein [Nanoarchaeota archaeon]
MFEEESRSFSILVEKLEDYIGEDIEKIVRIHELKTDFLEGLIEPLPENVMMALSTAKKFIEKK